MFERNQRRRELFLLFSPIGNYDTEDVAESLHNLGTLSAINNERTLARNVSTVPHLTLSWSDRMATHIEISTDLLEDLDRGRCLLNARGTSVSDPLPLWFSRQ
uniref:Uncharacterized protein n=1 Tax=Nelumbo nucifera TaxID=4432 RepID=A0A822XJS6_NELNU|nr:TPA_asm: hypothetical protein HUJ06_022093 [Nelumbo nucifera]